MAKRPEPKKDIDITAAGYSPIRMLAGALIKRGERKRFEEEDAEYQKSLKEMGMLEEGGGRANVPISKDKMYMAPPKDMRRELRDQKIKPKQKEYRMDRKSTGGKMKSADGIAIKGKTRLSMKGYGKIG
mgnify:CR=1 FL=1